MITYRLARPDEREKCIDFINMVFSVDHEPHNFKTLLPKVYADDHVLDAAHFIAVDEAENVRGLVAMLPETLRVLDQELRLGFIGSVSVHPYARGEGHMKALVRMAIDDARARGFDLLALGGQRQRYEHFGFAPGGASLRFTVTRTNLRHALGGADVSELTFLPMREAPEEMVAQAHALHADQFAHILREPGHFPQILESWRCTPYILLDGGAFAGYLTASQDGTPLAELRLIDPARLSRALQAWMLHKSVRQVEIELAGYGRKLPAPLCAIAEEWSFSDALMLNVLNFPRVIECLMWLKRALGALPEGETALFIDGQPLTLHAKGGDVRVLPEAPEDAPRLSAMEAQRRLFSPLAAQLDPIGFVGALPFHLDKADDF